MTAEAADQKNSAEKNDSGGEIRIETEESLTDL